MTIALTNEQTTIHRLDTVGCATSQNVLIAKALAAEVLSDRCDNGGENSASIIEGCKNVPSSKRRKTVTKNAVRPELGDRAWEVEWITEQGGNEFGDHEPDLDKWARRIVKTEDMAWTLAKSVYVKAVGGFVQITEVEFIDPYDENIYRTFRWECVGETKYYEGE